MSIVNYTGVVRAPNTQVQKQGSTGLTQNLGTDLPTNEIEHASIGVGDNPVDESNPDFTQNLGTGYPTS